MKKVRVSERRRNGGSWGMASRIEQINLFSFFIAAALFTFTFYAFSTRLGQSTATPVRRLLYHAPPPTGSRAPPPTPARPRPPATASGSPRSMPHPPSTSPSKGERTANGARGSVPPPPSTPPSKGHKKVLTEIIVGISVIIIAVFALIAVGLWKCRNKRANDDPKEPGVQSSDDGRTFLPVERRSAAFSIEAPRENKANKAARAETTLPVKASKSHAAMDAPTASRTAAKDTTARYFTYKEILEITGHFGEEKPTSIYSGRLHGGPEVAVKKLGESGSHLGKLHAEKIKILMRIRHPNLVSLLGFCEERQIILVYEKYMAYGSLFERLKGDGTLRELTWKKRLQIALDAATGLEYLHTGCKPPIVHRDITSANILLNEKLEAKLANFGLSKAEERDGKVGTEGYVDPEYFYTGKLDKTSDVYSFGIVLFELITGQLAVMFPHEPKKKLHLTEWIVPKLESGERESLLDPSVKGQYNTESVREVIEIAKAAIYDPSRRPDMIEIVRKLRTALRMETASVSEIIAS